MGNQPSSPVVIASLAHHPPTTALHSSCASAARLPRLFLNPTHASVDNYNTSNGSSIPSEFDWLDFLCQACKTYFGANHCAPVNYHLLRSVLEVSVGVNVTWIRDMALAHANVHFTLLTRSLTAVGPCYLNPSLLPGNIAFRHSSPLDGLPFPGQTFDFVHARFHYLTTPVYPAYLRSLFDQLRPGTGHLELYESTSLLHPNHHPAVNRINHWLATALRRHARIDVTKLSKIGEWMYEIGLVDVGMRCIRIPIGERERVGLRRLYEGWREIVQVRDADWERGLRDWERVVREEEVWVEIWSVWGRRPDEVVGLRRGAEAGV